MALELTPTGDVILDGQLMRVWVRQRATRTSVYKLDGEVQLSMPQVWYDFNDAQDRARFEADLRVKLTE